MPRFPLKKRVFLCFPALSRVIPHFSNILSLYINCSDTLNSRYVYYALLCQQQYISSKVRRSSVPRLSRSVIESIVIPIPPTDVQQYIVNILDRFDALCNDLTSGLPAEIAARKKQYEYYRDRLLTFQERT